ncbi:Ser/Thr protein kinase RdoA (MazF antagonist) [Kitasatospora sp. GAS204A]|uniref:phosphotransferase enzyme family protein n=1 Tax=unclassified Kitasatospora TaxID=2633591 RepID=UPI00247386D6|nr:phosphotransferase [Kitasatospora sp. GAS204B]MDH6120047.1 Ser/Thr protein kinase RdoA (MazF antagonist) [Kitasatospora sp. GAS204B]
MTYREIVLADAPPLDGPDAAAPPVGTLSPPVPRQVIARVLRDFRVGRLLAAEPVAEGLLNRGYRVTTDSGRYFLKCYVEPATATSAAITAQHRASGALAELGLPVPPPLAARDGRTVTDHQDRHFALYPWVAGRHRTGAELTPTACGALGTLLAELHGALARVCAPVTQPVALPSADPDAGLELAARLAELAARRRPYHAFDRLAEYRLAERADLLGAHRHRRPAPTAIAPSGWVHGDFHGLNLLHRGERVVAVLDWDRLRVRPRAEETVRAATLIFNDPATGELDLARVRHYARGYRATAGAGAEELALAVHRVWWERLNDFWMLQWRYQRADPRADPLFPAAAAQTVWWCQEYEQVLDAFVN